MSFIKKLFGDSTPAWASNVSRSELKEFQVDVEEVLRQTGQQVDYNWAEGTAFIPSIQFNLAFNNLIKEWTRASKQDRKKVTEAFLHGLLSQVEEKDTKISDCLDRLMIRMHDIDSVAPEIMVTQPIGNFLFQSIVIDSETTTRTLHPKDVNEQGQDPAELLELARKNLLRGVNPEINRKDGPFGRLTFIEADYFGASFLSVLDRFTEVGKTYWVSIPNRNMTLLLEPTDSSHEGLSTFLAISRKISDSAGNQYILPFILEYKDGVFRDLCKVSDLGIVPI